MALALAPILAEAGVPAGVVQIVPGDGPMVGTGICQPRRDSRHQCHRFDRDRPNRDEPGRRQHQARVARIGWQCTVHRPADADLEFAADQLIRLKLFVSGQVCVTANRVFVHADHERSFTQLLADRLAEVRVGNGLADGIDAGPLVHAKAVAGVQRLVDQAVLGWCQGDGDKSVIRTRPEFDHANFFPPTLLTDVDDAMHLCQQEIFGPVIPLLRYQRLDEVITRANATQVGLAGLRLWERSHSMPSCRVAIGSGHRRRQRVAATQKPRFRSAVSSRAALVPRVARKACVSSNPSRSSRSTSHR